MSSITVPLPVPADLPNELRDSLHWIVWKAELREDKVSKIPCDATGTTASFKKYHSTLDAALAIANRLRVAGDHYGVGLAFTDDIGFIGVDLDAAIVNGERAEHLDWAMREFPTWGEVSLSGVGVHLFYLGRFTRKRNANIDGARFEIFGTTGFIAVTGRAIADVPMELASFEPISTALTPYLLPEKVPLLPRPRRDSDNNINQNSSYGQAALRSQCDRVRMAPHGSLHYTLCSAATSLGRLIPNYLGYDTAKEELYRAAEDAGGEDMDNALKTIEGQLEFGQTDPATPADRLSIEDYADVDLSEFGIEEELAPKRPDPGDFPEHLLNVPGFIGEVAAYTNQNSFVLQPVLALAGALALLAVLTGRKIADRNGVRTNCYILSVAGSGEGKDAARNTNKEILYAAGAGKMVGAESWASGPGLLAAVNKTPAVLFQNDEIGRFLQTTSDPRKAPHLFSIISILLKLYSSSNSVFLGDAYADADKQTTIVNPHAIIYGTTVPNSLYEALTEESITSGMMGRMFIFETNPRKKGIIQDPETTKPPKELIEAARQWVNWHPTPGNLTTVNPDPFVVPSDDDANEMFRELRKFGQDQTAILGDVFGSLWVRCTENAKKLALLYACSANFGADARIDAAAASWACEVTKYLVTKQCWTASQFIARNYIEATSMAVERIIRGAGEIGIDGKALLRRTRNMNRRERDEYVSYLLESKLIKKVNIQTKGRPRSVYIAI